MEPPRLELPEDMSDGSRQQYRAVHRWLLRAWWEAAGAGDRTLPSLQAFLRRCDEERSASRVRLRLAQTLVNRHWQPRPPGASVRLLTRRERVAAAGGKGILCRGLLWGGAEGLPMGEDWWRAYVPHYLLRRWAHDGAEVLGWLRSYVGALGACALRRGLIRSYVAYVHRVLVDGLGCTTARDLLALRREALVTTILRVVPRGRHPQRICRIAVNRFLGEVAFRDAPGAIRAALHVNTRDLDGARQQQPSQNHGAHPALVVLARERDHFTETEVAALLAHPALSRRDRLVLRILAETGLRRRAASWLTVDAVYDRVARVARPLGHATEKGLVTRTFQLSEATRTLLVSYMSDEHGHPESPWLFPNRLTPTFAPVAPSTINGILVRACRAVGVRGKHVHTHGLRKFCVVQLMRANNRIEDVCKWIGHRAINTTCPAGAAQRAGPHPAPPPHLLGRHRRGAGRRHAHPVAATTSGAAGGGGDGLGRGLFLLWPPTHDDGAAGGRPACRRPAARSQRAHPTGAGHPRPAPRR